MDFERYLEYIDQPVLVIDKLYQVTVLNDAFARLFPHVKKAENIHEFTEEYPLLGELLSCGEGQRHVEYNNRVYAFYVSFVRYGKKQRPVARCILFSDITETVTLLESVSRANAQLSESNGQLKRQNAEINEKIHLEQEAAAVRETGVILRDLHDTLGHTLTLLNALNRLALMALPDGEKCRAELSESLRLTKISLAEMTSTGSYQDGGITAFLRRFRESMLRVGLDIVLDVRGTETPLHRYLYGPLMRICQEAATNSIRHGNASRLYLSLRLGEQDISLRLEDNGSSASTYKKGNGLIGIEERVNGLFGECDMGKGESGGFFIGIHAPVISD